MTTIRGMKLSREKNCIEKLCDGWSKKCHKVRHSKYNLENRKKERKKGWKENRNKDRNKERKRTLQQATETLTKLKKITPFINHLTLWPKKKVCNGYRNLTEQTKKTTKLSKIPTQSETNKNETEGTEHKQHSRAFQLDT